MCGVARKDVIGICEPFARPCLFGYKSDVTSPQEHSSSPLCLSFSCVVAAAVSAAGRRRNRVARTSAHDRFLEVESPREDPDEYALETRAAALFAVKAVAVETVERPGFTRKLSSFLFGEQEEETQHAEPEPSAPKFEEMYNQIAAWYNQPENAALRARWGPFPEPDEFQTWPGFVRVTNAFLDATVLDGEALTSPASNVVVDAEPVSPGIVSGASSIEP